MLSRAETDDDLIVNAVTTYLARQRSVQVLGVASRFQAEEVYATKIYQRSCPVRGSGMEHEDTTLTLKHAPLRSSTTRTPIYAGSSIFSLFS